MDEHIDQHAIVIDRSKCTNVCTHFVGKCTTLIQSMKMHRVARFNTYIFHDISTTWKMYMRNLWGKKKWRLTIFNKYHLDLVINFQWLDFGLLQYICQGEKYSWILWIHVEPVEWNWKRDNQFQSKQIPPPPQ